jgi:hypothetical protein
MAYKTVVANPSALVRQMVSFLRQTTQERGDFALAMLLPSDTGLSDKWNIVVSAPWIDRGGLRAMIPTITSSLLRHLSKISAGKLERVSVLPTTDPLVVSMTHWRIPLGEVSLVQQVPLPEGATVLVAEPPGTSAGDHAQPVQTRA